MNRNSIAIATIFSVICVSSIAASAIPSISVDGEQTTDVGLTNKFNIILNEAPTGLSGYKMTVSLANASLGEITSIDFPGWALVNSKGSMPADSVLIKAVDIRDVIKAGANNIILATANVRRDDKGNITLNIIIEKLDDDNGNLIIKNIDSNNVQNQSSSTNPVSNSTTYVDISIIKSGQTSADKTISDGTTAVNNSKERSDKISTNDSISTTTITSIPAKTSSTETGTMSQQETGTKPQQETSGFQIIIALMGLVAASIYGKK